MNSSVSRIGCDNDGTTSSSCRHVQLMTLASGYVNQLEAGSHTFELTYRADFGRGEKGATIFPAGTGHAAGSNQTPTCPACKIVYSSPSTPLKPARAHSYTGKVPTLLCIFSAAQITRVVFCLLWHCHVATLHALSSEPWGRRRFRCREIFARGNHSSSKPVALALMSLRMADGCSKD